MNNEPIVTVAAITAGVTAVLALLAAFGLPISPEQSTAILGVVAVLAPFAVALIARNFTVAYKNVQASVDTSTDKVVAGPASPLPNGTPVEVTAVGPGVGDGDFGDF